MTVATTTAAEDFFGNGNTTTFPCQFKAFDEDHLEVYLDGVLQTLSTHYTVSGIGNDVTDVVFVTAPPNLSVVSVFRKVPLTQETDYLENDEFPAETHERALDLLTMGVQQVKVGTDRAVRAPDGDPANINMVLPAIATREGKLLSFDSDGEPVAAEGTEFGLLTTGEAHTWTGVQTFQGHDVARVLETLNSIAKGPLFRIVRKNTSPATSDSLGAIMFDGSLASGVDNTITYAQINAAINTLDQDGQLDIVVRDSAGVLTNVFRAQMRGAIPEAGPIWFNDAAGEGPYAVAWRRSNSPAAADQIGTFISAGHNSDLDRTPYFKIKGVIGDPTAGAEDGVMDFLTRVGGVDVLHATIREGGFYVRDNDGNQNVRVATGQGSPEGVRNAVPGSIFLRTDGGAGTSFYVKESGTGNTGWVAK